MSSNNTPTSNYGRQQDNQQGIKQFIAPSTGQVSWIYQRELNGSKVITTSGVIKNVLIKGDLQVIGSIYNLSDKNAKNNIQEINENVKDNIFRLNPVEFNYINDSNNGKHYGFIAQDVEKIYPELVNTNDPNFKNVNYIEIIPILLAKMKDMDCEIKNMKKEMENMKKEMVNMGCEIDNILDNI